MYRIIPFLAIGMDCLSSMLLLTPAILLFQKASGRKVIGIHTGFLLLYTCTLAGIFSVTGLPDAKYCRIDFSVNLIPLVDILDSPMQYLLNILMFLPVGFLLPLLWERYTDWKRVLGFGCFLTVFIETAQVFTFRTTDIDDLMTNLAGAGIGYLAVRLLSDKLKVPLPLSPGEKPIEKYAALAVFLVAFLIHFFIEPYWSAFFWDSVYS